MSNPAGDYTKVDFGHMERVQEQLLKVVTDMDKATDDLVTKLRQTLGEQAWAGGAANFFEEHRAKWDRAEQEMGRQLHEAAVALGVANDNYRAAEARNKAIWSSS
ncbi:WXG100 family type VII secretion target [Streptosporangium sandarakinum]|uniref:WXG100 family type VII secretion target n=1 Tax=Streptosporangium sandarakinum TaxID=1260955 RepID=UPI00344605E6